MKISNFLAKFLGLYMIIAGAAMFYRYTAVVAVVEEAMKSDATLLFMGVFSVLFGLVVVLLHNIWEFSWRAIITVLGWITLIRGTVTLFSPDMIRDWSTHMMASGAFPAMYGVVIALGLFLTYRGFTAKE